MGDRSPVAVAQEKDEGIWSEGQTQRRHRCRHQGGPLNKEPLTA